MKAIDVYFRKPSPVSYSKNLSELYNANIWFKLELWNPTGTHKDRESQQIVQDCLQKGYETLGCASSGNFAISLAYFAWLSGLTCHVWLSVHTDKQVIAFLEVFSASIHLVEADLSELYDLSSRELQSIDAYNANPGHCPPKFVGNAEIGQEIKQQIEDVETVVCCLNNGSHLIGVAQGLGELSGRLIGVYSNASFAASIHGLHLAEGKQQVYYALGQRKGKLIEATTNDLQQGMRQLLSEGLIPEISSAATVGVLEKIDIKPNEHICCIISGSGLRSSMLMKDLLDSR